LCKNQGLRSCHFEYLRKSKDQGAEASQAKYLIELSRLNRHHGKTHTWRLCLAALAVWAAQLLLEQVQVLLLALYLRFWL